MMSQLLVRIGILTLTIVAALAMFVSKIDYAILFMVYAVFWQKYDKGEL